MPWFDVPPSTQLVYEAGSLEIDTGRRELRARGVPVPIGGRAFEIIEALARSGGELVTKRRAHGAGIAGRHRRGKHAPGSYFGDPQSVRSGSDHVEDGLGSWLSLARPLVDA